MIGLESFKNRRANLRNGHISVNNLSGPGSITLFSQYQRKSRNSQERVRKQPSENPLEVSLTTKPDGKYLNCKYNLATCIDMEMQFTFCRQLDITNINLDLLLLFKFLSFVLLVLLAGSVKVGVKLLLCDAFWETGYGWRGDQRKVKKEKI